MRWQKHLEEALPGERRLAFSGGRGEFKVGAGFFSTARAAAVSETGYWQ